eukprot:1494564-Amphidinium_carterae.3
MAVTTRRLKSSSELKQLVMYSKFAHHSPVVFPTITGHVESCIVMTCLGGVANHWFSVNGETTPFPQCLLAKRGGPAPAAELGFACLVWTTTSLRSLG